MTRAETVPAGEQRLLSSPASSPTSAPLGAADHRLLGVQRARGRLFWADPALLVAAARAGTAPARFTVEDAMVCEETSAPQLGGEGPEQGPSVCLRVPGGGTAPRWVAPAVLRLWRTAGAGGLGTPGFLQSRPARHWLPGATRRRARPRDACLRGAVPRSAQNHARHFPVEVGDLLQEAPGGLGGTRRAFWPPAPGTLASCV